ncbi:NAD(P)H-hydrate dehydratase [Corynebacterium ureicelerivorans]|uniref:bifunctional ADP-dependent NAD(P)H-hydrate dehydratase/NAD(P)H-hydrate epimerase n=1 Tax=Corynebacterium ureicelerivorans TaxID=401472 RepID=UPI00264E4A21|nr:bifunctional ADP-dependent NAD(P)H-hydrate dehydratase/NAD(P)H-hydrate epimerase [Corynebacterium ureicelerivorans]MDN8605970.1 NAD(P)H-hydrate dehydratase [Corynebacterium ureicelerivorans]
MYASTFTADQIRAAEAPLLAAQAHPDQLMQSAAHAVFEAAEAMLGGSVGSAGSAGRVLVLAGPGGNGGDALYAGAELALAGQGVDALLTAGHAQQRALAAFSNAGGQVLETLPDSSAEYALAIDGITGIGGSGGLREELADVVRWLRRVRVLAVDVPSGVDADTGEAGELHITADATVTFGGWRRAHALAPECGVQLLANIGLPGRPLHAELLDTMPEWAHDGPTLVLANRAVADPQGWPDTLSPLPAAPVQDVTPGPADDKYSGGVVGIRAGSAGYPGAAVLTVSGAVMATPAMVRYAGPEADGVVRVRPEVVVTRRLEDAGRVQAWVFGPGAGTGEEAARELAWALEQQVPLLIDADGLTLITQHEHLRQAVASREEPTVLTPHDGEFSRLREAAGVRKSTRFEETLELAATLRATIVRKGRITLIAPEDDPNLIHAVDAGHSWAATPGSGDVLAGIMGAHVALSAALAEQAAAAEVVTGAVTGAVTVHAVAAWLAAQTPFGPATAPAGRIAEHVRDATAEVPRA